MRINPNFANPIPLDEPTKFGRGFTFYKLESLLPDFIFDTRYLDVFKNISKDQKNYLMLKSIEVHIPNVEDKFSNYLIEMKGLIIPGRNRTLDDFEESFTKIKYDKFKQKRVNPMGTPGESFKLTRGKRSMGKIITSTNYVISQSHPKLS